MALLYSLTGIGLMSYMTLVWFLASWLGLNGSDLWIMRIILWLIGLGVAGLVVYFAHRKMSVPAAAKVGGGLSDDVQFVLKEANNRLRSSYKIRKTGKDLSEAPLVLVVGESGSTKTTAVLNSGLDPELLSGQAAQDGATLPTRAANVWLAGDTAFVEAGGPLVNDPPGWARLIELLRAHGLGNLLGRTSQSPRAVVLCVDAPSLLSAQAAPAVTALARKYASALGEVAQRWGTRLPVYTLFTRIDQVPYFTDYARNLTQDQVNAVFGVTLPLSNAAVGGGYNEQETRRLTDAFESLFLSLADKRLPQLRTENDPAKLPNIYEFPREFRKLRDNVVRFLLDVGRPSQLRASAFLRGFYFIGVRPVVAESVPSPLPSAPTADSGATRIFTGGAAAMAAAQAMAARSSGRRVPQWVFLRQFFADVLLSDRAARGTSGANTRASLMRRILLLAASLLLLIWMAGATVAWFKNRALVEKAQTASRALAAFQVPAGQPLPVEALRRLDEVRQVAEDVTGYERKGAPWSYRWGVYPGRDLYDNARALYCRDLGRTMLLPSRSSMEVYLDGLKAQPLATDDYDKSYRTLKSYLMTTSNPDKTDVKFLQAQMLAQYSAGRQLALEEASLVRAQYAFYGAERAFDMCPAKANEEAVERAQNHLRAFPLLERTYRNILSKVSLRRPSIKYTDPVGGVIDPHEVRGEFAKAGWPDVKAEIDDVRKNLSGEPWVLGQEGSSNTGDIGELQQKLRQRYAAEYLGQWNTFLGAARIAGYAGFPDASKKLEGMIQPTTSSLMRLLCLASTNTAVESPDLSKAFGPIQKLVPPDACTDAPVLGPNQPYISALSTMQLKVQEASQPGIDPATVSIDAMTPKSAVRSAVQTNLLSSQIEKLLMDPIVNVEGLLQRAGPQALNDKGADFCRETANVFNRFPFNRSARDDVKIDDVNAALAPETGKLWEFYKANLQDVLVKSGSTFSPKSTARIKVNPGYISFLNRAATASQVLYAAGPGKPALMNYRVEPQVSTGVESFTLQSNGRTMSAKGTGGPAQDFTWTGGQDTVRLVPKTVVPPPQLDPWEGNWAIFRFLAEAVNLDQPGRTENGTLYEFNLQTKSTFGRRTVSEQAPATLRLRVTSGGNPLPFGISCVSKIAQ